VFVGASFLSPAEAAGAVHDGYADRLMWGADYPHMEGTFQRGTPGHTLASLRFALAGLERDTVEAIVGGTAIDVYGFDRQALQDVARDLGAPTFEAISSPLDAVPAGASSFAFRTHGPWA
jgi:hypothetical protein